MALSIEDARAAVLAAVRPLPAEDVPVRDALGRVLAEDVAATGDVPAFANSAMDGFAVRSGPAGRTLTVVGESRAGAPATVAVGDGEAIRISTGAAVPEGADAVLQIELVSVEGDRVRLEDDVDPGRNVRPAGDDLQAGDTILRAGTPLGAAELGVAVASGRGTVACARVPRVVVLATGDELVAPGQPLAPGQLHETNGLTLAALATQAGARVIATEVVRDTEEQTRAAIAGALESADAVILSGGVSVGPHDHVKPALEALGVDEVFWRVALRPGRPTWFGTRGETLVFGLPGNPVSAMVTFMLFARPALAALQGAPHRPQRETARLTAPIPRQPDRDECVRVTLRDGLATPTGPQGSHQLRSMLRADGLAIVTAGTGTIEAGEEVDVERLDRRLW
ncbi:MAG TPA: gephyrin-like molybdotransferase Glp [Solirubrobacteraceae bacterium]